MGRQTNIKIVGTQANIIYYNWKGVFSMRTKPARVKQTKATKSSASVFGKAASLGAALRKAFAALLPNAKDKKMQLQFQTALQIFLQQYKTGSMTAGPVATALQGFRFNEKAGGYGLLQKIISINSVGSNTVQAELKTFNPVQELPAPRGTATVALLMAAASFNAQAGKITDQNFVQQEIIYTDAVADAKQLTIALQTKKGHCIMMIAALQFHKTENNLPQPVKQLRWMPAMVLGVWLMG